MLTTNLRAALAAFCLALPCSAAIETPLEIATKAFEAGQYAAVVDQAAALDKASPDWPKLRYMAGEAELVLGKHPDAERSFRAVLEKRPKAVPAQVGLGRALTALGKYDEAAQVLRTALAADPKDIGAKTAYGALLARTDKVDEARAELAAAWKLDPKNPFTARAYVEFLLQAADADTALRVSEAFQKARPDHPLGPFLVAVNLERENMYAEAIEHYQRSLAKDPQFLDAHKNLAILCHTQSNTYQDRERSKLAYEHYKRYFELGGEDASLKTMYESLLKYEAQILGG